MHEKLILYLFFVLWVKLFTQEGGGIVYNIKALEGLGVDNSSIPLLAPWAKFISPLRGYTIKIRIDENTCVCILEISILAPDLFREKHHFHQTPLIPLFSAGKQKLTRIGLLPPSLC